jgi:L-aminopeptidase/D-esterase-like protein
MVAQGIAVDCCCGFKRQSRSSPPGSETVGDVGSIIIVIATDAPLLPHQLKRLARRASLGLARTGFTSGNGSGDIFLAFSTGDSHMDASPGPNAVETVSSDRISPLFSATVEATKVAIVNVVGARRR